MPQPNVDTDLTDPNASATDEDLAAQAAATEGAGDEGEAGEAGEGEGAAATEDPPAAGADDGADVVITLDGTDAEEGEPAKAAPSWLKDLREANRQKERRIRELEQQLTRAAPAVQPLGPEPELEEFADAEAIAKYRADLAAWHGRKAEHDQQQRQQQQTQETERQHWMSRIESVQRAASTLKVQDYDDAAEAFSDVFSPVQQGIIIGGPDDPKASALLRYVLGKNPARAAELAAIKDPVKFAFAVAKLESQVKVTTRKPPPPPDRTVRAGGAGQAAVDGELAKLEAEADKSGDRSKVAAYHRRKRQAESA